MWFIPIAFHNFCNYDCHLNFMELVDRKHEKVKYDIVPKTKERYISVTYGGKNDKQLNKDLAKKMNNP